MNCVAALHKANARLSILTPRHELSKYFLDMVIVESEESDPFKGAWSPRMGERRVVLGRVGEGGDE